MTSKQRHTDPNSWQAIAADIDRGCKYFWDRRGGDPFGQKWTNPYPTPYPCKLYAKPAKEQADSRTNPAPSASATDSPTHPTPKHPSKHAPESGADSRTNPESDNAIPPGIDPGD